MRIAVDMDNTLYDTNACSLDLLKHLPKDPIVDTSGAKAKSTEVSTWFNPKYLISEAISALQGQHSLYICTARQTSLEKYTRLFEGTGLKFEKVFQARDYSNKAKACLHNNIDILVDDSLDNLRMHYMYTKTEPLYKTHFVLYLGNTGFDIDYVLDWLDKVASYNSVSVMTNWSEFNSILKERK